MGEIFGEYLKSLRIDRKLTLRQLEEQTQISNGYLSQVERGERNPPTMKILVKLAKALGVPLSALSDKAEEELRRNREQAKESKEEEELKAKLPTEEEIKKLFDKFQLMVNGKCIGIPTWNYDDLAKSIRSLIIEKENRMSCDRTDLDLKALKDDVFTDRNLTVEDLERNEQLISMIRFLIDDNALSSDFYITTILEYFIKNRKEN